MQIWQADSGAWTKAAVGLQLEPQDQIKTGADSSASISFFEGSTTEILANAEISIKELSVYSKTGSTKVSLNQTIGDSRIRVGKLVDSASRYEIATPSGLVTTQGTEYIVEVFADGTTVVTVIEGTASAIAQGVMVQAVPGWECIIYPGSPPMLYLPPQAHPRSSPSYRPPCAGG